MRKPPHVPQRTCVACRQGRPKGELLRIVRRPDGLVELDPTGKSAGRGAYVCRNMACAERGVKQKKLTRALGTPIGEELLDAVRRFLE